MALNSSDLGSRQVYPYRLVPPYKPHIPNAGKGGRLAFLPSLIYHQRWVDPIAADDDGYSAAHAGADAAGTTSMTLGGALASGGVGTADYARNVVITVTHATSVVAMSGVITGTDKYGRTQTEDWSVTATGTSKVFTGSKSFKTVTSITEVVAADASANTIKAGTGKKFGLDFKAASPTLLSELEDGAAPTAGTLVAASAVSTAAYRGTYAPNSAPDGALDFDIWYLVDDITVQP